MPEYTAMNEDNTRNHAIHARPLFGKEKKTKYLSAIAKNRLRNTHPSSFMSDGLICASFEMFGVLDSNEVIAEIEPSELNVGMAARRCCLSWLGD